MENKTQKQGEEIRDAIIAAAETRFQHYGVSKTTMAEIATDLDMSAANLYRYFQNKQDIAAACAERCMQSEHARIADSIRSAKLSAGQRLQTYIQETLRINQQLAKEQPRIHEMVTTLTSQRQDLIHDKIQRQCQLIAEILQYGNQTSEFAVSDVTQTARTVYATLALFEVPIFGNLFSEAEFQALAGQVAQLLINGLRKTK